MEVNQYFYSLAKISAQKAAENGVHVDPKFIYTQWYIETGGFTSQLQATHHNLGGVTASYVVGDILLILLILPIILVII